MSTSEVLQLCLVIIGICIEMLIYCDFSNEHGSHVRHSNVIERMSREIYRRIRAVEKLSNGYASIAG